MLQARVEIEARHIEVRDGKAYIPFNIDDLYWLIDKYSSRDDYRQVLWALIQRMESEQHD